MKPHEETWVVKNLGPGLGPTVEFPTRNGAVSSGLICGGVPSAEDRVAVMRLITAAPEMARAILAVLTCQNRKPCASCRMTLRSTLSRAGVPLP